MSVADLQAALASPGANALLTHATVTTVPTGTGETVKIALADPGTLAAQAGLSREAYALARCITSEGYGGSVLPKRLQQLGLDPNYGRAAAAVAIGQAIRNGAKLDGGKSIEQKLTYSKFVSARGYFGEQSGRYAATTLDPTMWAGQVAQAVLADDGGLPDLARGAHKFLDLAIYKTGIQAGKEIPPLEQTLKSWMDDEGLVWKGPVPTIDTYHLALLGRGSASLAQRQEQRQELLDIFAVGKAGNDEPEGGDPDDGPVDWTDVVAVLAVVIGGAYLLQAMGVV
jgi:hypothetical protein